ncbi:MAG: choice-of-anchor Q domain-containing protein [Rivularia sp. (in: cyanobacteria)]
MTIYVNINASGTPNNGTSWENAFTDLQSAINAATSGQEIWVAAGTYKPTTESGRNVSFELPDGVTIYGGFAGTTEESLGDRDPKTNVTILSGNIGDENDENDNSYTVVKLSSGSTATLDGFTIKDGNSNDDGGGVYNDGTLTLKNVVVRNNQAADDGGGIRNNGTITIIDSTIADNTSIGTTDTSGGGGLINTGTSATIINSTFSGNTAKNGGAIRNDTVLELINSTLSGNTASESGGGLVNTIDPILLAPSNTSVTGSAQITIINSTITNNTASDTNGSGIANFAIANISNSIIAENAGNDDIADNFNQFGKTVNGKNNSGGNNIIGNGEGVSGFTNQTNDDIVGIQANPINPLLDALKDNGGATQTHALLEGSPAIDAGNNDLIAQEVSNLDGRVVGDAVDIGAFEYKPIIDDVEDNNSSNPTLTPLTDGKDRFRGTATDDNISSGAGNDFLKGGAGNDVLDAGADNDRVYGGVGEDTISGGTGNDYLNAGEDNDSVDGEEGRDRLYGGDGNDTLSGGVGNDFLKGEDGNDSLDGGEGRDRLYGGDGADTLTGGSGNDMIYGGDGDDMITGVNADSFAVGEIDRLYGGDGNDTFVLGNANGAFYDDADNTTKGNRDYAFILDFETGDTIQLHGSAEDYILDVSRGSTSIYMNDDGVDGLSRNDELIGVIKGVEFDNMSSGFNFVPNS